MTRRKTAMFKRIKVVLLGTLLVTACLGLAEQLPITGGYSFISTAYAVVGRPLTPVSVAGVARRTSRRCAAGVYNC
jgi:hypothetical protein